MDEIDGGPKAQTPTGDEPGRDKSLLIVDDDRPFLSRIARAMEVRGYHVETAESVSDGIAKLDGRPPAFAIVDLRIGNGSGLDIIAAVRARRPDCRAIVLTGYGNIATAVNAVKLGAIDYLPKPSDADDLHRVLMQDSIECVSVPDNPMSADRVRWEHIQRVYDMCERNVSETARRLNMHRRTLQRILAKRAPK